MCHDVLVHGTSAARQATGEEAVGLLLQVPGVMRRRWGATWQLPWPPHRPCARGLSPTPSWTAYTCTSSAPCAPVVYLLAALDAKWQLMARMEVVGLSRCDGQSQK